MSWIPPDVEEKRNRHFHRCDLLKQQQQKHSYYLIYQFCQTFSVKTSSIVVHGETKIKFVLIWYFSQLMPTCPGQKFIIKRT